VKVRWSSSRTMLSQFHDVWEGKRNHEHYVDCVLPLLKQL